MLQVLLKALFDLGARLGIRITFWNRKIQKYNFWKNQKPYNFCVFWATRTIHTFLKSLDKTVIIRQGQKSDTATGKGSGAKFSLYRRTHCNGFEIFSKMFGTKILKNTKIVTFFAKTEIARNYSSSFCCLTYPMNSSICLSCIPG